MLNPNGENHASKRVANLFRFFNSVLHGAFFTQAKPTNRVFWPLHPPACTTYTSSWQSRWSGGLRPSLSRILRRGVRLYVAGVRPKITTTRISFATCAKSAPIPSLSLGIHEKYILEIWTAQSLRPWGFSLRVQVRPYFASKAKFSFLTFEKEILHRPPPYVSIINT